MRFRSKHMLISAYIIFFIFVSFEYAAAQEYELTNKIDSLISFIQEIKRESQIPKVSLISYQIKQPINCKIQTMITHASNAFRVDPNLIMAIIHVESNFNQYAVSPKGAMGLMQLMPATANDMGIRNPFNTVENIFGGTLYYRYCFDIFGNHYYSLIAYNAGPQRVIKGRIPKESKLYAHRILRIYQQLKKNGGIL